MNMKTVIVSALLAVALVAGLNRIAIGKKILGGI